MPLSRGVRGAIAAALVIGIATTYVPSASTRPVLAADAAASVIARYRERIPELMDQHGIPGLAVALVDADQALWLEGFGHLDGPDSALRQRRDARLPRPAPTWRTLRLVRVSGPALWQWTILGTAAIPAAAWLAAAAVRTFRRQRSRSASTRDPPTARRWRRIAGSIATLTALLAPGTVALVAAMPGLVDSGSSAGSSCR